MLGEGRDDEAAAPAFPPVDPLMTGVPAPTPQPGVPDASWPPPAWPAPAPSPYAAPADPYAQPSYAQGYAVPSAGPSYPGYPSPSYGYAPVVPWMPAPPPSRVRRRTVVIAVVTAVAVLLATVGGIVLTARSADQRRAAALAAATAAVTSHLPGLERFVAATTSRPWKQPVVPEVLDDAAFVAALHAGGSSQRSIPSDDDDDMGVTTAAMGLAPSADDFWNAYDQSADDNVVGFYDDTTTRLVVRGTTWAPDLEYTLVHELTHANQDQSFDLSALSDRTRTDDESSTALRAVIEGEASYVADDYYQSQDASWRSVVDARESQATASDVAVVDTLAGFPYSAGEEFVATVRGSGGSGAVTRAFTDPPRWTRDIADPDGWLARTLPTVTIPPRPPLGGVAKSDLADYGVLGVLGLWMTADNGDPDPDRIGDLAGWAGDSYIATDAGSGACFTDDVTFVDKAGRDKAMAYLGPWLTSSRTTATDTGALSVRLHGCHG